MQKDPKKLNLEVEDNNSYPGQRDPVKVDPLSIDLLPSIFRTDTNKKIFGAMVEDLFQPSSMENVNFQVGRPSSASKSIQNFLPRKGSRRQLEAGLLVQDAAGTRVLTADDIAKAQGHHEDHLAEPQVPVSVLDLPIDPDKFLNWNDYYWVEQGMPTLYLSGPLLDSDEESFDVERDIIGKKNFTLPTQKNGKCVELKNGMIVVFERDLPGCKPVTGDAYEIHVADGSNQIDFQHEMTQQYDKSRIIVKLNAFIVPSDSYDFTEGSLIWNPAMTPPAGHVVEFFMPDFWVTYASVRPNPSPVTDRRWLVTGVGSPGGIKLLGKMHQTTDTVYSSKLPAEWDRVNIAWDRIEWSGDIRGINAKHYVLMSPGAENLTAHSRINVWTHKDTIKAVADYLDVDIHKDIVTEDKKALRPILEFDSSLELYQHAVKSRHWVDGVVSKNITDPEDLANSDLTYMMVATMLGTIVNGTDPATGLTTFRRIADAIDDNDFLALDNAIRGLSPRNLVVETITKIRSSRSYLFRGIHTDTLNYKISTAIDSRPRSGEFKFDSLTFIPPTGTTMDMVLRINAEDLDARRNDNLLARAFIQEYDRCLFRIYDPNDSTRYAAFRISGLSTAMGRTTRSVELRTEPNEEAAIRSTLPADAQIALIEDRQGWFFIRSRTNGTIYGWTQGGVVKDFYAIPCRTAGQTVDYFNNGEELKVSFVRVEDDVNRVEQIQRRILWLADGPYKNKIVTFRTNAPLDPVHESPRVVKILTESAKDDETTTVRFSSGAKSLQEYRWIDGECREAQTRRSMTDVPKFRVYDRDMLALDQWFDVKGFRPSREYSTIAGFLESGAAVDTESGFKISFLPSQFRMLDPTSSAANAIYDIEFDHTLQDDTTYFNNATDETRSVPGPYSFRRFASSIARQPVDLRDGLSSGYRRGWFRLRSWVINSYLIETLDNLYQEFQYVDENGVDMLSAQGLNLVVDIQDGRALIDLPMSAWPTYEWAMTYRDGELEVQHRDDFTRVVENIIVGGIGERIVIDSSGVTDLHLGDAYTGESIIAAFPENDGRFEFDIPSTLSAGVYDLTVNSSAVVKFIVIDPKFDPRAPMVKVDGLPVDYDFIKQEDGTLRLRVSAQAGIAEVRHQGQFINETDHATSLPGLEYNAIQDLDLTSFSPARLLQGMQKCIWTNSLDGDIAWTESPKLNYLNGPLMADTSSIRGRWAMDRLNPNLSEAVVSRSMASWRWYRRFVAAVTKFNNENDLTTETPEYWLNRVLEELTVGINYSQPDAVSGMAFSTNSMNRVEYVADGATSEFGIYTDGAEIYDGIFGPDHIYVYVNGQMWLPNQNYKIGWDGFEFQIQDTNVVFSSALPADTQVKIFHAAESSIYSGIPASPAKLGLGGVFRPEFTRETWDNYDRFLLQRHDGSRVRTFQTHTYSQPDPRDAIMLELEKRIYAGCLHRIGDAQRQRMLYMPADIRNVSAGRAQACLEWFENNDVDFRARLDYIADNPWTWNWYGRSWRAIYIDAFGTVRPHTHPWEMMGYDEKPQWWDNHYSWTDADQRLELETALHTGLISEPGQPATYDLRVRRNPVLGFPVNELGVLVDPGTWGMPLPSAAQAQSPWDLGSLGTQEEIWLRSPAGIWARVLDILEDTRLADAFVETGITPFVEMVQSDSPTPIGLSTQGPSNFVQARPTIGIGAVLFEANREINLLGESPLLELGLIQVVLQFAMGGFTDNAARFRMYHTKYQNSSYVPEEDFSLTINPSVPQQVLRYSAVRLQRDGAGFRVFGYDPVNRYFDVATPVKRGPSGSNSGTYQRTVSTASGTVIRYLVWNTTDLQRYDYGSYINDKQELFEFFIGLEEFQKSRGMMFDQYNDRGTFNDWEQAAIDAFTWIDENWDESTFVAVSPISGTEGFKIYHQDGQLDRLDSDQLKRGKILFFSGRLAQNKDLLVTREIEESTDYVQPQDGELIAFADIKTRDFDHVYFFNSYTRFGDMLFDRQANIRLDYLSMIARRTRGWDGRVKALGLIPQEQGLLPGFDTLVTDLVELRRPEKSQFDTFKGNLSKSNVVPAKNTVLSEIIEDSSVLFQYRQGLQTASGTNLSVEALFRNREFDIPGRTQDLGINEQWLFNDGEFGKLGGRKIWEILLKRSEVKSKRQVVRFSDQVLRKTDSKNDTIIDVLGPGDNRWITRDFSNVDFSMIDRDIIGDSLVASQQWLPSAGVANLVTTDISGRSVDDVLVDSITNEKMSRLLSIRSYSKFVDYKVGDIVWYRAQLYICVDNVFGGANTAWDTDKWAVYEDEESVNVPPTIWVSDYAKRNDQDQVVDYGWNYLQMLRPMYVEEACPNALETGLNESKVTFASPHGCRDNDIILLTGSGDGNYDRLHRVIKVVDSYNLLIAARSTGDNVVYDMVAFRVLASKFTSLAELNAAIPPSIAREGMKGFVEPDGTPEGDYLVYVFTNGAWGGSTARPDPTLSTSNKRMVDTHSIEKVMLIDSQSEEILATLEVYDPYKGLVIDEVGQYIDYRTSADPAVYNIDELGLPDLDSVDLWGANQLGKIWWDTSRVRYIEYEQSDLKYRVQNWGRQIDGSEVAVYEWTRSTSIPNLDDEPDVRLDYSSGSGIPRYSAIDEEDYVTGAITTYYYYWKRRVDTIPIGSSRRFSALDIETVLQDPDAAGVSWFSPVFGPGSGLAASAQFNAFIVANIDGYLGGRDSVIIRIVQRQDPEQQHTNGVLVSEGFNGDAIPEYLYRRMRSSLAGRDRYRKNVPVKTWTPNTSYEVGDLVIHWSYSQIRNSDDNYGARDIPIITELNGDRGTVKKVLTPVLPDFPEPREVRDPLYREKLHRVMVVTKANNGTSYLSGSSFLDDYLDELLAVSPVDALIKDGLDIEGYRACIEIDRRVPDSRLNFLRRFGNQYVPVPQTWYRYVGQARRNFIKAANAYLLNINVTGKTDWDKHLRVYRPLSGPLTKDLTPYWYHVDYFDPDYVVGSEQYFIAQGDLDIDRIYNDARDGIFGIVDELGKVQSTYFKQASELKLLYQKNGTIQIVDDILLDAWDKNRWDKIAWDEDNSEVIESLVTALRENIFTGSDRGYFNVLFFDMVKESLRQIPRADWVSKTTYLDISQVSDNDLTEAPRYFDRRDIQIKEYVNEVKPYHSKIIDINQNFSTQEEFSMAFGERMEMSVIRNVEVLTRDYFTDKPLGNPSNPQIETQAMFNPTRSGEDTVEPELPVTWTQSPLLSSAYMVNNRAAGDLTEDANMFLDPNSYSMLEISDPDRKPEFFRFKDPDTPDIEEI